MAGYSLQQLLEWTTRDHLIDTYSIDPDGSYLILIGDKEYVLNGSEARSMLIGLLRDSDASTFGSRSDEPLKA